MRFLILPIFMVSTLCSSLSFANPAQEIGAIGKGAQVLAIDAAVVRANDIYKLAIKNHPEDFVNLHLLWLIDMEGYIGALVAKKFYSRQWQVDITVEYAAASLEECGGRGATAFVVHDELDAKNWKAIVYVCPRFFGTPVNFQAQILLHELVHAVHGIGECRPISYAENIMSFGLGRYYDNNAYWEHNKCDPEFANAFARYKGLKGL